MNIVVRNLDSQRDMPGVLAIVDAQQRRADSKILAHGPEFYACFRGSAGETFVAVRGEVVIGFALLAAPERLHAIWPPRVEALGLDRDCCGCLAQVIVAPEARGRGLSSALVDRVLEAAQDRALEHLFTSVAPDNTASVRMVKRGGFRQFEVATVYSEQVLRALFHCELLSRRGATSGAEELGEASRGAPAVHTDYKLSGATSAGLAVLGADGRPPHSEKIGLSAKGG